MNGDGQRGRRASSDDGELFRRAMRDVRPLKRAARVPPGAAAPRATRALCARRARSAVPGRRALHAAGADLYECSRAMSCSFRRAGRARDRAAPAAPRPVPGRVRDRPARSDRRRSRRAAACSFCRKRAQRRAALRTHHSRQGSALGHARAGAEEYRQYAAAPRRSGAGVRLGATASPAARAPRWCCCARLTAAGSRVRSARIDQHGRHRRQSFARGR